MPAAPASQEIIPGFHDLVLLNRSGDRVVYRATSDAGEDLVLKTLSSAYPHKVHVAELRREYQILERLNIPGVIRVQKLVPFGAGNLAIAMESFGTPLSRVLEARDRTPLPVEAVLALAMRLARALAAVHEHGLVHKNLSPRNVLVNAAIDELRLIDFSICSELSRERQSTRLSTGIGGALAYISPEQTGRTEQDLDFRSDYYSLGVMLFELLTGSLSLHADDPLEWVHRHITQVPPLAHEVNPNVPPIVSAIVARLMEKNVEQRYQSALGIVTDLEICHGRLTAGVRLEAFPLGGMDMSQRFRLPQRLFGRAAQAEALSELFEGVVYGDTQVCLISGPAGIGKSSLVAELSSSIVRERGYLVEGKFDQLQQSAAYGAFAHIFRGLVEQLLGETAERLESWRVDLQAAVGVNGQLIVDMAPDLALILGPQPAVPQLPPSEAQNRLQIVLVNFLKVFAARHPLVIFMDDLQWSDIPSLNLLARLATIRDMGHLLLIGAYRTRAVDTAHPLAVMLDQIRKTREIVELDLGPLDPEAIGQITAEVMQAEPGQVEPLSQVIFEKSQGNPFFVREILKRLNDNGAIAFNPALRRWAWDMPAVRSSLAAENVVEFMATALRNLPESTQQVLQFAACIGNTFDLETLAIIAGRTMSSAAADLREALTREMILPLTESYRFAGLDQPDQGANATYKFQHDRVQQAAYDLIDPAMRAAVRLSIGRLILSHRRPEDVEDQLINIVGHLNAGRTLIVDPQERHSLSELNLRAGLKAVRSSAYTSALTFLHAGCQLLGEDPWNTDYELMLSFSREIQQCAYLTGAHSESDAWAATILQRARTPLATAEFLAARTRQFSTMARMRESIDAALDGLELLGFETIREPTNEDIVAMRAEVERNLAGREIQDLIDAPTIEYAAARVAIRILMEVFPAAFLSGAGNLFPYLVLLPVNLALLHGNSPEAAFAYTAYGMLLCGVLEDPALGSRYGQLGVAMNQRFNDIALKARILYVYAMFVHHWSNHWASMTPWFLKGIEAGYQAGDLLYLAYSAQDCILWDPSLELAEASLQQRKYLAIVKDCSYRDSYDSGTLFLQMQLCFQGLTSSRFAMHDETFSEEACLSGMRERRFITGIANYHIYKAEIHALFEDFEGALAHVQVMDQMTASVMSLPQLVRFYIVAFLTRAALYSSTPKEDQPAIMAGLRASLERMTFLAGVCADNFEHLRLTMQAELSRLNGNLQQAMQFYESASSAARASGFLRDEATANQLAARCLITHGLTKAAAGYLRAAHHLYDRWGASAKVRQMEEQFAELADASREPGPAESRHSSSRIDASSLDVASVMKACSLISGEIVLDQLLKTTLHIMLESAGGERGLLVVREDGQLSIAAHADTNPAAASLQVPLVIVPNDRPALPFTIVNNVLRTGASVVLSDATSPGRFSGDPYIVRQRPRSILCVPIHRAGRFTGAIYMENNLSAGVFSQDRVEVLKMLAAQAAISIENAKLFEGQVRLTLAQQRFVPAQFLSSLGRNDIAAVGPGEYVAMNMSVLFADLRNFTPLVERLPPQAVIALLNRYFSSVGEPIGEAGGFIDSFNGDEIMALFPMPADCAVQAGVQMRRALAEFNRESVASSAPSLEMGIGVNTGPLVLGTVGSQERLKCGVIGDVVNTAARIEQLTKFYAAPFLIGEQTYASLTHPERFSVRAIDRVAAKGKELAVMLYEVLDGETGERRAAKEATRPLLDEGMRLYFARDFHAAQAAFTEAGELDREDAVLRILSERARRYADSPPPPQWHGVETLTHK
jgi:predicted ATPase/class 3 adenylate cyclase